MKDLVTDLREGGILCSTAELKRYSMLMFQAADLLAALQQQIVIYETALLRISVARVRPGTAASELQQLAKNALSE